VTPAYNPRVSGSETPGLLGIIREDRRAHKSWFKAGFHAIAVYRLGVWRRRLPSLVRPPFTVVYWLGQLWVRNVYSIEIPSTVTIGRRVVMPHGGTIVIAPGAVIGDGCVLRHNVTIGAVRSLSDVPTLGKLVKVGTGAVILGAIAIGDRAEIGPNAVVLRDVPDGATVFVDPGRVVTAPRRAWPDDDELEGLSAP
jgi:serine O-acetyltransferase